MSGFLERIGIYRRAPDARAADKVADDIREELAFHLAERERELVESGLSAPDAARRAREEFGDVEQVFAECRDVELGERVMLQRVNFALTFVALLLLGVFLWRAEGGHARTADAFADLHAEIASLRDSVSKSEETRAVVRPVQNDPLVVDAPDGLNVAERAELDRLRGLSYIGARMPTERDEPAQPERLVYVIGKVKNAGSFEWSDGMTLTKLIAESGGLDKFAAPQKMTVMRTTKTGRQRHLIDFSEILAGTRPDFELQHDDVVYVPETFF